MQKKTGSSTFISIILDNDELFIISSIVEIPYSSYTFKMYSNKKVLSENQLANNNHLTILL